MLKNIKKILIKEYRKKTKSGKNPIKIERKKTQPNRKKKLYGKTPYRKAAEKS